MFPYIWNIYKNAFSGLTKEIWLLSLVMLINRMGAMVLPFMSIYLTSSLKFSLSDAGYVMGFYGAGSILGAYTGGVLTDKYNYHIVQIAALGGSSVLLLLIPSLVTFWPLVGCIFIFSFLSDMLRPANSVAIATYSKTETRVRSFSLMRLSINLGFAIGPALGGLIAYHFGYSWIFYFDGATCLIALLLIFMYLPYKPNIPEVTENPETFLPQGKSAYTDFTYLTFIGLVIMFGSLFFQLFTTVPVYLKEISGYSEMSIGLFMAFNGLLIVVFEMPLIQKLEKRQDSFSFIGKGFYILALSFVLLLFNEFGIFFTILYTLFITISEMFIMPFMINYAISRPGHGRQGQYMALYSMGYGVSHILAPTISMNIASMYSFSILYIIIILLSLASGYWFFYKSKQGFWQT
ncbi:MAG: MFS transporter [Saprospiraceae bacterium]|nr:MFS transporter [Saprospiraceae bacterium]